jgi:D-serine deaminase-like pyridoxal phosphate-dependent protein
MIVDLDTMEENITKLFQLLKPTGVDIRPHLKTTKSPILAQKLIDAGAKGGCVAKISEAEVMVANGIEDIFITCEIVGAPKVARLVELFRNHPQIRIVVDSVEGSSAINNALAASGIERPLQVLIDVNVGQNRTGVKPGEETLALARHISTLKHLNLIGVHGYEGHLQHVHSHQDRESNCRAAMSVLASTADLLRINGFNIKVVTTGGTGTAEFCATSPGITEVQPGSFIFMDTDYRNAIGTRFSNSLTILSTVISKPEANRVVIDAGLKSLTTDSGYAEPKDLPGVEYTPNGDEHGSLSWESGSGFKGLEIGDRVEMIPSHIDPTVNLHDFYYAHRKGVIEEIWPVATRGKVQ